MSGLLPCGPPWEGTDGARGMFGISRSPIFSSTYTRYRMGFSTCADLSCASDNLCSVSAEIAQLLM